MLLLWHLKSYLPAHSILRGFVALHLCNFADAIRAGCAEANRYCMKSSLLVYDAIRAGCAEANITISLHLLNSGDAIRAGCAEANKGFVKSLEESNADAIRAGCAEANTECWARRSTRAGCNPCGMC